jgi:hypothetical protein
MKWEYESVGLFGTQEAQRDRLNELGARGWELVGFQNSHFVFKRPIEKAPAELTDFDRDVLRWLHKVEFAYGTPTIGAMKLMRHPAGEFVVPTASWRRLRELKMITSVEDDHSRFITTEDGNRAIGF